MIDLSSIANFLNAIPGWVWWIIEILAGIAIENRFAILQRTLRAIHLLFNDEAQMELTIWIESETDFSEVKKALQKTLEDDIQKVKTDKSQILEIKLKNYDLHLRKHSEGVYILETERVRAGIRNLKKDLRELTRKISELRDTGVIQKIKNVSLDLYLPYKWKHIKALTPDGYEMKDYEFQLTNQQYKCFVSLHLQSSDKHTGDIEKVNFKNVGIDQLTDVLADFTGLF